MGSEVRGNRVVAWKPDNRMLTAMILAVLFYLVAVVYAAPAAAQVAPDAPPPIRQSTDAWGVDLVSGTFNLSVQDLSIGDSRGGGLVLTRRYYLSGWRDSFAGTITLTGTKYVVSIGGASESFTPNGGAYSPAEGQGSALTYNSSTLEYTYTSADGSVAVFRKGFGVVGPIEGAEAFITSLTTPDGSKLTYNYTTTTFCYGPGCFPSATVHRLQSVTNNHGYQVHFDYALNGTPSDPGSLDTWITRTRATAINMAVDYCGPVANTCPAFSIAWPHVDYGGTAGVSETVTNSLGQTTTYTYDASRRLSAVRAAGSATDNLQIGYDASGRVLSVIAAGVSKTYSYNDGNGMRTTTVTDALGHAKVIVSDLSTGLVSSKADALGRTTSYLYDSQGRVTRITSPAGDYVAFTYDPRGNITETRHVSKTPGSPADVVSTASFDTTCTNRITCNKPNYTIDPRNARTDYTYSATHGGTLTITAPAPAAGAVRPQVSYAYTALQAWYKNASGSLAASGQPIQVLTQTSTCRTQSSCAGSTDEFRTTISWGTAGVANNLLPTVITSSDGSGASVTATTLAYDAMSNLMSSDGPLTGSADLTRFRYDDLRRRVGIIRPDPDGAGPRLHSATRNTYNALGRLIDVEVGTVTSQTDAAWEAFSPVETTSTTYDAAGRPIETAISASGNTYAVHQLSYDVAGRLDCLAVRMNPNAFSALPASACSPASEGVWGPDRITKYAYTAADELWQVTKAFGTTSAVTTQTRTYTASGKLKTIADGRGNLTTFEYDRLDRLEKTRFPDPASPGTSSADDYEQVSRDASGNVISVRQRNGKVIALSVDSLNRVRMKDLPGTSSEDVYFDYDNQGRLTSARFGGASGPGVTLGYDALGRLQTRTAFGHTLAYAYDNAGNRTRITHPDGFYAEYAWNVAGQLTSIIDSTGTTLATFQYDDTGRRKGIQRGTGASTSYDYDPIGRLGTLTQDMAGSAYDNISSFAYNPAGQIVTRSQSNDAYVWSGNQNLSRSSPANGLNQTAQINGAPLTYDSSGKLTAGNAGGTYTYDVESRLRTASLGGYTATLSYDPLGMLSKIAPNSGSSTELLYDGADLVVEYSESGAVLRRFVHGPGSDEPIAWYEGADTSDRRWLHGDERGSIVATSNASGSGTSQWGYSPDGETDMSVGAPFQYTGQLALPELSLYYYKARFYSPKLGRFLGPDPAGYTGGMNLYAYVGGDPVNSRDPSGLFPVCSDTPTTFSARDTNYMGGDLGNDDYRGQVVISTDRLRRLCWEFPDPTFNSFDNAWTQTLAAAGLGDLGSSPASGPPKVTPRGNRQDKKPVSSKPGLCFGTFSFVGLEADLGEASGFAGTLAESTVRTLDAGSLYELALGGEGAAVGLAGTQSFKTAKWSFFGFAGLSISAGPLAGVQAGIIFSPHEFGFYYEGHRGWVAGGGGAAVSSCGGNADE